MKFARGAALSLVLTVVSPASAADPGVAKRLELVGVVLGHPESAIAVIEDRATRKEQLYHAGDLIQGATILSVTADRAVLRVGGEDIVLRLGMTPRTAPTPAVSAPRPLPPALRFRSRRFAR